MTHQWIQRQPIRSRLFSPMSRRKANSPRRRSVGHPLQRGVETKISRASHQPCSLKLTSVSTALLSLRSDLFPTRATTIWGSAWRCNSLIQLLAFSSDDCCGQRDPYQLHASAGAQRRLNDALLTAFVISAGQEVATDHQFVHGAVHRAKVSSPYTTTAALAFL